MKSETLKIFFAISALAILMLSTSSTVFAITDLEKAAQFRKEVAQIEAKITELERQIKALEDTGSDYSKDIKDMREEIQQLKYEAIVPKFQAAILEAPAKKEALNNQATTLEQQAAILEAQAAAIQAIDPLAAQQLRNQATLWKNQASAWRAESAYIGSGKLTPPASPPPPTNSTSAAPDFSSYTLIVPIPSLSSQTITNPLEYIKGIYNFAVGFGILIAVAVIVFAGIKWATSAGSVSATSEAKDMILNAIYGLVMLLGAILILSTINPALTKLTLPKLDAGKQSYDFSSASTWEKLNQQFDKALSVADAANSDLAKIQGELDAKQAAGGKLTIEDKIRLTQAKINAQQAEVNAHIAARNNANQQLLDLDKYLKQLKTGVSDDLGEQIINKISNMPIMAKVVFPAAIFIKWWNDGDKEEAIQEIQNKIGEASDLKGNENKKIYDATAILTALQKDLSDLKVQQTAGSQKPADKL